MIDTKKERHALYETLWKIIKTDDLVQFEKFRKQNEGIKFFKLRNNTKSTMLHAAIHHRKYLIAQRILEIIKKELPNKKGIAKYVNHANDKGVTALHDAAIGGRYFTLLRLLENGANPNANTACYKHYNAENVTPLICAIMGKEPSITNNTRIDEGIKTIVTLLAKYKARDRPDKQGNTALHWTAGRYLTITVETLAKGASYKHIETKNQNGFTPLHKACARGDIATMQSLIDNGADIKTVNHAGETLIHTLIGTGTRFISDLSDPETFFSWLDYFIENGLDINAADNDERKPLDLCQDPDISQILETKYGAKHSTLYTKRLTYSPTRPTKEPKEHTYSPERETYDDEPPKREMVERKEYDPKDNSPPADDDEKSVLGKRKNKTIYETGTPEIDPLLKKPKPTQQPSFFGSSPEPQGTLYKSKLHPN